MCEGECEGKRGEMAARGAGVGQGGVGGERRRGAGGWEAARVREGDWHRHTLALEQPPDP